ncbi:6-bladed beta-propeller [Parabacteroides massiliensis]|uniref:6-bladed beta-propeller n=1 Tax=Parabacteroides massiliensis TaxID=1750560 RepID=UPI001FCA16F5|nr:6-bladed beta-propeller [Parabacteroides massiliensis]
MADLSPKESRPTWTKLFSDRYEITPLETTSSCLIGQIDKIRKFRNHYYILSSNGKTIHHFDKDGKFVSSLNRQGQGPEEYPRIEDFDVCEADGKTEVWISDNKSLKVYDATDFSFKRKMSYPFVIHKFKKMENSHVLLVTGQNENILTLVDEEGKIIAEYLKKEIPYIMFRPVQFVAYKSGYLFQLGISNTFVSFNPQAEQFQMGHYVGGKKFLTEKLLLEMFQTHGVDFILEANKYSYINNMISLGNIIWLQTHQGGKNYLTKVEGGETVSTQFSYGTTLSTISDTESDDSILLYIMPDRLSEHPEDVFDKFGNKIICKMEDNPCILEFF